MKKEISAEKKRLMICLLINTLALTVLYFWLPSQTRFEYLPAIYLVAGVALGLFYLIYNRGFVAKNITPEMLPDTMTPVEKHRFMEDARERERRSRWVLTLIIPIIVTFFVDIVYMFIFPYFERLFG